jgi:predicted glutamine amidotransferase
MFTPLSIQPTISRAPRFGCRQLAFMTETPGMTDTQKALLSDLLQTGPQSLKAMSDSRTHANRDGITTPFHFEDMLKGPQRGNPHGWGLAAYSAPLNAPLNTPLDVPLNNTGPSQPLVNKSLSKASSDPQFDTAVQAGILQAPYTLFAHLLNKVDPNRVLASPEDTHPFTFENWSGMFNGILDGGRTEAVTRSVQEEHCTTLCTNPKGTNTGEKFLLTFLGKLKQQTGQTQSSQIPLAQIKKAFCEALDTFLNASKAEYRKLDGTWMGLKGDIQLAPGLNYIATDGRVTLAYRKGNKLYLNRHEAAPGKSGYLISSEPMQTDKKKLEWVELPQDHLLTLERQVDGKIHAELTPLRLGLNPPA